MIFRYFEITPKILRPIIPIVLKSKTKLILYSALIDSGADYCIFSLDIADALSIKLNANDEAIFMGAGKEKIKGFWSKIRINISGTTYEAKVIFAEISDFGHGILGQNGFFDHFKITFDVKNKEIEVV